MRPRIHLVRIALNDLEIDRPVFRSGLNQHRSETPSATAARQQEARHEAQPSTGESAVEGVGRLWLAVLTLCIPVFVVLKHGLPVFATAAI